MTIRAYVAELETTGEDHDVLFLDAEASAQRVQANADQNLAKMAGNAVLPVPCPHCGTYQEDMVRVLKEDATSSGPLITGLIIAGLSLISLAFSFPFNWVVTTSGVIVGLGLIGYGDYAQSHYDPNVGDPEPRKARGRRLAVCDEELADLIHLMESQAAQKELRAVAGDRVSEN